MEERTANEQLVKRIEWIACIFLAVTTVGGWLAFSAKVALGIFLGGLIAGLSFQVLKWQLRKAFQAAGRIPQKGRLFLSYYLRFLTTLILVFLCIYFGWANPIAFLVGLSSVAFGITVVGGFEFAVMLTKKGEK
ncbi:MAG: ATP synthase subunit I [Deltaproteobacteria bacterium]|nr:ATP synthase subunit I [Deltaproteobacteria bacterium]